LAQPTGSSGGAITLDDLIALNDEMIALVRAGVPLEEGMRELGRDLPGKLGAISSGLAARIERGESLDQALADSGFPPVYRAVAEAGMRAGHLPAALESMATSIRRLAELRRMVSLAILYPLVVFLLTYGLFVFLLATVVPTLVANWTDNRPRLLTWLNRMSGTLDLWGPIVPIVVIGLTAVWWYRSRRAALAQSSLALRYFGWVPSLRSVLRNGRAGVFCEILTVLVAHGVPLAEALRLAGRSSGDRAIGDSIERMASRIESGQQLDPAQDKLGFAPLLSWVLLAGQPRLVESLRYAAESYQRRAARQAEWLATYLPLIFTGVIGGAVTLLYATTLFLPWSMMMREFAGP
jgi:type II secretory pathway component PulF